MNKTIHIACDLDATLAQRLPGEDLSRIGEPIQPMIDQVKIWLSKGYKVSIFTARVSNWHKDGSMRTPQTKQRQRSMILRFLEENGLPALLITADKSPQFTHFVDDKAVEVYKNKGVLGYIGFNRFELL